MNWRHIYLYDDAGKQISTEAYGSNDVLEQRTVYRYDDTGKQIASDTYDGEGNLIRTTEYN